MITEIAMVEFPETYGFLACVHIFYLFEMKVKNCCTENTIKH